MYVESDTSSQQQAKFRMLHARLFALEPQASA
jgi:hypothetical protein